MKNARLDEAQSGIKIAGRNIDNLIYADDTSFMAESEEELKNLSMKVKEESKKSCLKTQHSKNKDLDIRFYHFMANGWGKSRNSVISFSCAPKSMHTVTAAMKLKRCLLLGRIAMTNLDGVLKSRDTTLPTKSIYSKLWFFQ